VVHQEGESVESALQHQGVMTDIKDGRGTERFTLVFESPVRSSFFDPNRGNHGLDQLHSFSKYTQLWTGLV
jgi:hypothetical protein